MYTRFPSVTAYFDRYEVDARTRRQKESGRRREEKRGRDTAFVIHTRRELVSVPNKPSNFWVRSSCRGLLQFLLAPSREPLSWVPVSLRASRTTFVGETRASNRYSEPESFADRSRVRAEPRSSNPLLLPHAFYSLLPMIPLIPLPYLALFKAYVPTFIVQHDTEIYPFSLTEIPLPWRLSLAPHTASVSCFIFLFASSFSE